MAAMDHQDAAALLAEVRQVRHRARARVHAGVWLPMVAVAALLLVSSVLYRFPFSEPPPDDSFSVATPSWAGLQASGSVSAPLSYAYWFIGIPVVIAAIGGWYALRARRVGMRLRWQWFAATGVGALLLEAVIAAVPVEYDPNVISTHGNLRGWLTPLWPLVAALIVLGFAERSRGLVLAGAWVGVVTGWNCYFGGYGRIPGGNVTLFGLDRPGPVLVLAAAPLLLVAAIRAPWRSLVRHDPPPPEARVPDEEDPA
ncbi:MAG TPA: hypothetical protein VKB69_02435 [Micromonosporaceae bacterium]|nr:hypothetical protein [Micromonosporaceae bacterium]